MLAKHITASNDCFSTRKGSANTQIRMVKAKTRPRRRRRAGYLELARVHKVSLWPFGCLLDLREGGSAFQLKAAVGGDAWQRPAWG